MVNASKNQPMTGKLEFMMPRPWTRVKKLAPRILAASHLIFFLKANIASKILDATNKIKAMDIFLARKFKQKKNRINAIRIMIQKMQHSKIALKEKFA